MPHTKSLDALSSRLGLEDIPHIWRKCWNESQQASPECLQEFLRNAFVAEVRSLCPICPEGLNAIGQTAQTIASDHDLLSLLRLWHFVVFHSLLVPGAEIADWPVPIDRLGDQAALFSSVAFLTGARHVYAMHESLGIPADVTSHTLSDIDIWLKDYYNRHGKWGMSEAGWMVNHFTGRLFWLGRLQFVADQFPGQLRVYRNRDTHNVVAFVETGTKVRSDGQINGSNDVFDEHAWTATLIVDERRITGYRVSHLGYVHAEQIELPACEWQQALAPGDAILVVHIPASGKMDYDECGESLRWAVDFYHRHFPGYDFSGFATVSWLLDPQLEKLLPPESNIVRFLSEFYLYPMKSDDGQTFVRIFGSKPENLASAPRDTALRRAVLDFVSAGNQMRMGGGFILVDDLDWGNTPYRNGHAFI